MQFISFFQKKKFETCETCQTICASKGYKAWKCNNFETNRKVQKSLLAWKARKSSKARKHIGKVMITESYKVMPDESMYPNYIFTSTHQ